MFIRPVYAQGVNIGDYFLPAKNFSDIGSLLNIFVRNIFTIGGVVFLAMFVIAGFKFIRKAGKLEPAEFNKVRDTMGAAVVGLVIMFVAYWLVRIIEIITGVSIFNSGI